MLATMVGRWWEGGGKGSVTGREGCEGTGEGALRHGGRRAAGVPACHAWEGCGRGSRRAGWGGDRHKAK